MVSFVIEKCWNVTGSAGLTNSIWYLRVGYWMELVIFLRKWGERENADQKDHQ